LRIVLAAAAAAFRGGGELKRGEARRGERKLQPGKWVRGRRHLSKGARSAHLTSERSSVHLLAGSLGFPLICMPNGAFVVLVLSLELAPGPPLVGSNPV